MGFYNSDFQMLLLLLLFFPLECCNQRSEHVFIIVLGLTYERKGIVFFFLLLKILLHNSTRQENAETVFKQT